MERRTVGTIFHFVYAIHVFVTAVYVEHYGTNYKIVIEFMEKTKCLDSEKTTLVRLDTSLGQCALDCVERHDCFALNFRRQFPLCEYFGFTNVTFLKNSPETGNCVYIKRNDILVTMLSTAVICNCNEGEICDSVTKHCITPVCPKINVVNGTIFGNMNQVGSRIKYGCGTGYMARSVSNFAICQTNGKWIPEPRCFRVCDKPERYPNSIVSIGRRIEGITRSYKCVDKHRLSVNSTVTNMTCESDGEWTATKFECVADYRYLGCYENYNENRILDNVFRYPDTLTNEFCVQHCFSLNFTYAHTEAYEWCFCGNHLAHETKTHESECNIKCSGDPTSFCGGDWRASLFEQNVDSKYYGCYKDLNPHRILNGQMTISDMMNTSLCLDICRSQGAKYALTQNSNECFCGDTVLKAEKTADNRCNYPCTGNALEFCGGHALGSLFITDFLLN